MKISFLLEYHTAWGENVRVDLNYTTAGGKQTQKLVLLGSTDGAWWSGELALPATTVSAEYSYQIVQGDAVSRTEWSVAPHRVTVAKGQKRLLCQDRWRDLPANAYRYTSAFTEAFARHQVTSEVADVPKRSVSIRVFAPELPDGQVLSALGNQPCLGNWQVGKEVRLACVAPNEWCLTLDVDALSAPVEYKFLTLNAETGQQCVWENGENRQLAVPVLQSGEGLQMQVDDVNLPYGPWHGAGCVIPIFSIRSEKSFGVGDFGDLKRMIDWVHKTGQRVLQILPINDTTITNTWTDSYPYNSISIYAFHPQYVDLGALPKLKDAALRKKYEAKRVKLNALPQVDYEQVNDAKRSYLRHLYKQEGEGVLASKDYQDFYKKNREWLVPYAAFSYLRDQYGTPNFREWKTLSSFQQTEVDALLKKGSKSADEIGFYCYIQYLLHVQLSDACAYARSQGVVIKGDIPIGISRNSVEAWVEPYYFNLNGQAGAPPDPFSANGQNWGFPTYNWDAMLADGCQWWLRRFRKMAEYFDAYRIDHVLGFFRIWEIPLHSVHGLLGQFSPAMPMSIQEIESYGLPWRDYYTKPYIADWTLDRIFGAKAQLVRDTYLVAHGDTTYEMKPEYATQRQVEAAFAGKTSEEEVALKEGIYTLISDVLFVPDRKDPSMYHPRISVQDDYIYQTLNEWEKEAFNNLYIQYYYRRHNQFWYEEAMKKLPVLTSATRMLVCAEDLGMVPDCVPWVMENLKILTLEIQSMPKNPQYTFGHLNENPYRSVATISTHDMSTLRGWWEEDWNLTQKFYNEALYREGPAPHPMPEWLAQQVISQHLQCPSMLCLLSLQDWLSMDESVRYPDPDAERINIPANPRHYWRWRMHLTVEELMQNEQLNSKIIGLIKAYGR